MASGQKATMAWINSMAIDLSLALLFPVVPNNRSKVTWMQAGNWPVASLDLKS